MFGAGVFAAECDEETVEEVELLLLVLFLGQGEHRFGHRTDYERDDLLEG